MIFEESWAPAATTWSLGIPTRPPTPHVSGRGALPRVNGGTLVENTFQRGQNKKKHQTVHPESGRVLPRVNGGTLVKNTFRRGQNLGAATPSIVENWSFSVFDFWSR
jgi:hypothetical protein